MLWFFLYCLVYNVTAPAGDHRKNMMNELTVSKRPIFPTDFPLLPASINPKIYEEHHLIFAIIFWVKLIVRQMEDNVWKYVARERIVSQGRCGIFLSMGVVYVRL
jgi:hypothetical protein